MTELSHSKGQRSRSPNTTSLERYFQCVHMYKVWSWYLVQFSIYL